MLTALRRTLLSVSARPSLRTASPSSSRLAAFFSTTPFRLDQNAGGARLHLRRGADASPTELEKIIKEAFGPFGQNFVKIVVSQSPDRPARAFVEFQNKADAEAALNSPALRETFAPVRRDAPMTQPSPRLHVSREAGSLGMTVAEERALFARFGPNTVSAPEGESYYFFVEYETQAAADAVLREPVLKGKFDVGYAKTRLEGPNLTLFVVMKEGPAVPMAGLRRQDVRESFAKFGGPRLRFVRTRKDAPLIFADFQNQVDADAALNSPEMKEKYVMEYSKTIRHIDSS
ncbi:unnamed protein product [Mycena citricolor]|uniref:RRM domain-containing protein n=1 Tax=Mycena citricolor TaxID=2018698 RepID=A0AAD2HAW1_9AGAR|nr:unnamed protein product [Mycena citricolor]